MSRHPHYMEFTDSLLICGQDGTLECVWGAQDCHWPCLFLPKCNKAGNQNFIIHQSGQLSVQISVGHYM